jgi:hypothetical protein
MFRERLTSSAAAGGGEAEGPPSSSSVVSLLSRKKVVKRLRLPEELRPSFSIAAMNQRSLFSLAVTRNSEGRDVPQRRYAPQTFKKPAPQTAGDIPTINAAISGAAASIYSTQVKKCR